MPSINREPAAGLTGERGSGAQKAREAGLDKALSRLLGLVGTFVLFALLSCNPPVSTHNPSTLWVGFGQTELDLILVDSEPPYF